MAVITKTTKLRGSPVRETITDLQPGKTRTLIYNFGPLFWGVIAGAAATLLTTGIGRSVLGLNPKNEGRDWLESEILLAKLNNETTDLRIKREQLARATADPRPRTVEERNQTLNALQQFAPLTFHGQEIKIQQMEEQLDLQDRLVPLIAEQTRLKNETERDLAEQRAQGVADFLDTQAALRERIQAETDRTEALAEQTEIQNRLVETAIDGLDFFSKQQFLRERLFPPQPAPRGFISPTGIRTVTNF